MLREAVDNHARISYEALLGQGWDRHLFALRTLAERSGNSDDLPEIFTDSAYTTLSDIVLSTSTLVHPALHAGGFGPPGPNTYGLM
jgi:carnitine O-palmitoyltransferase 2